MPDRIQLSRAKGWRKPGGAVVVARPGKWGNPWVPGKQARLIIEGADHAMEIGFNQAGDREWAVSCFRRWLVDRDPQLPGGVLSAEGVRWALAAFAARREALLGSLHELRGRDLACWCPPGCACHATLLLELANQ